MVLRIGAIIPVMIAANERLRLRFAHAAQTHERAARVHASAAALFDCLGRPEAAARERAAAEVETGKAEAAWQEAGRFNQESG